MKGYLPYLPQDNAAIDDGGIEAILNEDLGKLLQLAAPGFWDVVKSDPTLSTCLDSYLCFKRCAS